jgi:hypothetical protein
MPGIGDTRTVTMPRPHIEFIHAQDLPWRTGILPEPMADWACKLLSRDTDTGACSVIVKIPAGWARPGVEHLTAAQEFFVLDGTVEIGGQDYGLDSYGYLPAGIGRRGARSAPGAVVLSFFDAAPETRPGAATDSTDDAIPYLNLHEMPWTSEGMDPELLKGRIFVHKVMRIDKVRSDKTVVLNASAHSHPPHWKQRQLHHPCVEEFFIVSGEITGPQGIMTAGAYFWRPAGIAHGPFGSRTGYLAICRFVGGRHVNVWHDDYLPYSYDRPHQPVLPEDLRALARPRKIALY